MSRYFRCETNKSPLSYKCGEKIIFTVSLRDNCMEIPCKYVKWELFGDDGKSSSGLASTEVGEPLVLDTSLERPGFVHLVCTVLDDFATADSNFDVLDAGAGAEVEKISYCDTVPEDFDEYWGKIEKTVADFPIEVLEKREVKDGVKNGFKAYDVKIKTPEGRHASGYITYPEKKGKYPLIFEFEGYSVVGARINFKEDMIYACFNAHGIENSLTKTETTFKYKELENYGFDKEENNSNMTCYWRNMMIRNLIAAKYLKQLPCWDKENFICWGGSQGAFQATTVAAHDKDVSYLEIGIPWFCNLKAENCGYLAGWRPEFAEGLRYFDTVAQAMRVKCPVHIDAGLGDYICPPSTVMALYNSLKGIKALDMTQARTHIYNPPELQKVRLRYNPENPSGELKKGIYRHFKGNEYEVFDIALNSETCEETVLYKALYGDGKIWIRPKWEFEEYFLRNGNIIKRFEFIK